MKLTVEPCCGPEAAEGHYSVIVAPGETPAEDVMEIERELPRHYATHEMAHAAAALALGMLVDGVTLTDTAITALPKRPQGKAFCMLAGPAASHAYYNNTRHLTDDAWRLLIGRVRAGAHQCDHCAALRTLMQAYPGASDDELLGLARSAEADATEFVYGRRGHLRAVAKVLAERGELSGDEAEKLLAPALERGAGSVPPMREL